MKKVTSHKVKEDPLDVESHKVKEDPLNEKNVTILEDKPWILADSYKYKSYSKAELDRLASRYSKDDNIPLAYRPKSMARSRSEQGAELKSRSSKEDKPLSLSYRQATKIYSKAELDRLKSRFGKKDMSISLADRLKSRFSKDGLDRLALASRDDRSKSILDKDEQKNSDKKRSVVFNPKKKVKKIRPLRKDLTEEELDEFKDYSPNEEEEDLGVDNPKKVKKIRTLKRITEEDDLGVGKKLRKKNKSKKIRKTKKYKYYITKKKTRQQRKLRK
jgi:hypothetical protein